MKCGESDVGICVCMCSGHPRVCLFGGMYLKVMLMRGPVGFVLGGTACV